MSSQQDQRIAALRSEAETLRNRLSSNDPVNSTMPPGQQPATSNFGFQRQIDDAQRTFGDQVQILEGEKISLMKRLNMVLSELEKATHEKSDIAAKLRQQERLADELKHKLEEVSGLKNVVNRNLQDDLNYERDLNIKLKDELDRFDKEKETLLSKLREEEDLSQQIARETNSINSNLMRRTEDLKQLEHEHDQTSRRLAALNDELESLRNQEVRTRQQKVLMDDQLAELTQQRNDLIKRMNELSERYETYVSTMNQERQSISRQNKQQVKHLVAKLLVQILSENQQKKRKNAFLEINSTSKQMANLERCLLKTTRIFSKYLQDSKRRSLRLWYRNAFNCVHETQKRNQLIDGNVKFKRSQKFFYLWRQAFLKNRRMFSGKVEATKQLKRVLERRADHQARHTLCRWRDFVEKRQAQDNFLYAIMQRKKERGVRRAYVLWLSYCKRDSLLERYEKMSDIVTETWFKQKVFLGLKHACQQSRAERSSIKFTAWKNWCQTARDKRYFEKKQLLVEKIESIRTERLLKKVFDAIKFSIIQQKFEETRDILNTKIPEKQELEYRKECLIKNSTMRSKLHVLRQCYYRHCDVAYKAIQVWKNAVTYYKQVMNRLKLKLIDEHKRRLRFAYMRWKESTDKMIHVDLLRVTEDHLNENQNLINELQAKRQLHQNQLERAAVQQLSKLERIANMVDRKMIRRQFNRWLVETERLNELERSVALTAKTVYRHRLRNNFLKFKKQAAAAKRQEFVEKKCDWFEAQRQHLTKREVWQSWLMFMRSFKLAKKFLNRANKGVERNRKFDAMARWKQAIATHTQNIYLENIDELKRRQADHQNQILKVKKDIEIAHGVKLHTISQMKSLSKKVMANFITRATHMQVARGFYTWVDATSNFNKQRRLIRRVLTYWLKTNTARAFRKWVQTDYNQVESGLRQDLNQKEQTSRLLTRQANLEKAEQEAELEQANQTLRETVQERLTMERSFQNAYETLVSRKQNNIYIDKRRHILNTWRDFVKRERNAVNVIGAIARRTLRIEVFQRIRMVAREKFLDNDAKRICDNFYTLMKNKNLKRIVRRWQLNSFHACTTEMEQTEQQFEELKVSNANQIQTLREKQSEKAVQIIQHQQKQDKLNAFKEMTRMMKLLRVKQDVYQQNIQYLAAKKATQKWFLRTQITLTMRRRNQQILNQIRLENLRKYFIAIKVYLKLQSKGGAKFAQVVERMRLLDVVSCFQKWQQFTISEAEKQKRSKKHGTMTFALVLDRLVKKQIASTLHSLRNRTQKKEFKEKFFKRMLQHCSTYRMRYYFDKWNHQKECEKIADVVNTEGEVVLRRNEYRRNAKALKLFLISQGYPAEKIEKYVQEKTEKQKHTMTKGVIALFFQNSEFNVVPKALNAWKDYVQQRKHVKRTALFVLNNIRHPLAGFFNRWKYDAHDSQKQLMHLTKDQLMDKIITDENLIGSSESLLQRMDEAIEHLAIQRENLLGHYIRGQKLAIALCKNNYMKSIFRAFLRWKRFNQECENMRLIEQLERTQQMISELSGHVGKLESINRNLLTENEELRQAALDGIEIAKVVQELTRERECLSHDLADRAGTIKKLIEDNNNLSVRLNIAQREAQQLEMMNQQVYMAPSDRPFRD